MNVYAMTYLPEPIKNVCCNVGNCNATNHMGGGCWADFMPRYLNTRSSSLAYELDFNEASGEDPPGSYYNLVGGAAANKRHT